VRGCKLKKFNAFVLIKKKYGLKRRTQSKVNIEGIKNGKFEIGEKGIFTKEEFWKMGNAVNLEIGKMV
jgi:hypothetical protein